MFNKNFLSRNTKIQFTLMNMQRLSSLDDIIYPRKYWYCKLLILIYFRLSNTKYFCKNFTLEIKKNNNNNISRITVPQEEVIIICEPWRFFLLLHIFYFFYYIMKPQYTINHWNGHNTSFVHLNNQGHNLSGRIQQIVAFTR